MTVYLVLSLPRIPYIHCIYMVLANPICKWFPHTSSSSHPHNPYTKEREPLHMHASTSFHARRMLQRPFMHDACFNDLSCTTHASTSFHARRMLQRHFIHDACFNVTSCTTHASTSFHARRKLQRHFMHDAPLAGMREHSHTVHALHDPLPPIPTAPTLREAIIPSAHSLIV